MPSLARLVQLSMNVSGQHHLQCIRKANKAFTQHPGHSLIRNCKNTTARISVGIIGLLARNHVM